MVNSTLANSLREKYDSFIPKVNFGYLVIILLSLSLSLSLILPFSLYLFSFSPKQILASVLDFQVTVYHFQLPRFKNLLLDK